MNNRIGRYKLSDADPNFVQYDRRWGKSNDRDAEKLCRPAARPGRCHHHGAVVRRRAEAQPDPGKGGDGRGNSTRPRTWQATARRSTSPMAPPSGALDGADIDRGPAVRPHHHRTLLPAGRRYRSRARWTRGPGLRDPLGNGRRRGVFRCFDACGQRAFARPCRNAHRDRRLEYARLRAMGARPDGARPHGAGSRARHRQPNAPAQLPRRPQYAFGACAAGDQVLFSESWRHRMIAVAPDGEQRAVSRQSACLPFAACRPPPPAGFGSPRSRRGPSSSNSCCARTPIDGE